MAHWGSIDRGLAEKPELVFALAAAVGTPLEPIQDAIRKELEERGYTCETVRLSSILTDCVELGLPVPSQPCSELERLVGLMDLGDRLRQLWSLGDALALLAIARIAESRRGKKPQPGRAYVIRQLKHPDEVVRFRRTYESAFQLISVYCPEQVRKACLMRQGMSQDQAQMLIERDAGGGQLYAQQLRETFCMGDVFVRIMQDDVDALGNATKQIGRYLRLVFTEGVGSPTVDEYAMHMAWSASLRSADLSRQVGAAIMSPTRELVSVGTNEVPAFGGGQYWEDHQPDGRDCTRGFDANTRKKQAMIDSVLNIIRDIAFSNANDEAEFDTEELRRCLEGSCIGDITEFGRAVHAEMEALLSAARLGLSVRGCDLFTTTFPCHNCAKHIVDAGIRRVVYIEPYPKSLALELHGDAISSESGDRSSKVSFEPFVGIAPGMYATLFSIVRLDGTRLRRKTAIGDAVRGPLFLRLGSLPVTYLDREMAIAAHATELRGQEGGDCRDEEQKHSKGYN